MQKSAVALDLFYCLGVALSLTNSESFGPFTDLLHYRRTRVNRKAGEQVA
jgi:hypothetical protein